MAHPSASSSTNNSEANNAAETEQSTDLGGNFVPHVIRIASLMNNRVSTINTQIEDYLITFIIIFTFYLHRDIFLVWKNHEKTIK